MKTIAILATDGFEQSELLEPKKALEDAGFTTHVIAPQAGSIKGWKDGNWADPVSVDKTLADANVSDYDALVLPGGVINPDKLRANKDAIQFIKDSYQDGQTVAAICHGPWTLIEAGLVDGKKMTSYKSIRTDLKNAGAQVEDSAVVVDNGLITSRNPKDLPQFNAKLIEEIKEGKHKRSGAPQEPILS